ncbi:MAG TPA: TonB-dependent receptor, partial [Gemmatimonadaceae bacterium]|nr:TonB-dependent receptor [Gemmatimonadaceae bacterium]
MPIARSIRATLRRTLVTLAGFAAPALLGAQATTGTVTGRIVDAADNRPLPGAYVIIGSSQQGVATREDGTYRLVLRPGTYELRARLIGYGSTTARVTVAAGQTVSQDFALQKAVVSLGEVAIVGTRAAERTVTDAPVPIDVLGPAELQATGVTETNQAIQMIAPSFNFPRPSIADGSDHIRPATLRGLGPDQVLVLVNGKRRHHSSLVNVNGTIGRGSAGVDLNSIPMSSIERIEILRDGAAAQYGSDAIAGVMNVVLKSEARSDGSLTLGQTYKSDGENLQAGGSYGFGTASGAFLNLSGDVRYRGWTNRADPDTVSPFFAGDPRNNDPRYRNVVRWRHGDALLREGGLFYNGGTTLGNGIQVYSFGGTSLRSGDSPANFRRPVDAGGNGNQVVAAIFPTGFLPHIKSRIWDISGLLGAKSTWAGWNWDLSTVYGGNRFRYDVSNTNNASLGAASPTEFYAGTMVYSEHVTNLDFNRRANLGVWNDVNVAAGAELRFDRYKIWPGDRESWVNGGVRIQTWPTAGGIALAGSQGFPGFQPGDAA